MALKLQRALQSLHTIPGKIWQRIRQSQKSRPFRRKRPVRLNGKIIFTMRDYGDETSMRIATFANKEPETLRWIDAFDQGDKLIDVGANVGVYSLYAGSRGHKVAALEPNALNFAVLNLNIADNNFGEHVIAYPYSIHESSKISALNIRRYTWGGAVASFDRGMDWKGEDMNVGFQQGSPGISLDDFVRETGFMPNHIKIDVDGNEYLVLRGAQETLSKSQCKSMLIELYEKHTEYQRCLDIIEKAGFRLGEKTHAVMFDRINRPTTDNYIFYKP